MIELILDKSITNDLMKLTPEGKTLHRILYNEKNIFVISKSLLTYIEENIVGQNLVKWTDLFQHLHDEGKFKSIKEKNTLDVDEIYDSFNTSRNYIIILKNDSSPIKKECYCCLKDSSKNNQLFKTILENNEVTFRHSDFNENNELLSFFKKIFSCSKTSDRLIIISRYSNFDCDLINLIKNNFYKKCYWTTFKHNNGCTSNNIAFLKSKLGNQLLVYTGRNEDIHERKIIIDSLLLEFDDDFNKVDVNVDTWKCTCIIDASITSKLREKQSHLRRLTS